MAAMIRIAIACALVGCIAKADPPPTQGVARSWKMRPARPEQPGPGELRSARLAFDSNRGRVVLYGGADVDKQYDAMWELTETGWEKLCEPCLAVANPIGTEGMLEPGFAYDPARDVIVMFGGEGPGSPDFRNDVWELAGGSWRYDGPAAPMPRTAAQLVYDPILGGMRMLGGYNGNAIEETWTFVDGTWALDDDAPQAAMTAESTEATYDADRDRVLVLEDSANTPADALWVHDAPGWRMLCEPCTTDSTPRVRASLVHIAGYDQTFLIGGENPDIPGLAGTWVLVDDRFEPYTTLGDLPPRADAGVVYDPSRDVVVLYGGWGDSATDIRGETWELVRD
jgi:hypothetical protein